MSRPSRRYGGGDEAMAMMLSNSLSARSVGQPSQSFSSFASNRAMRGSYVPSYLSASAGARGYSVFEQQKRAKRKPRKRAAVKCKCTKTRRRKSTR